MIRDARRFAAADLDDDKKLTKDELADFLHPGIIIMLHMSSNYYFCAEDAPHMQEIVLDETMDDMDKNKDGYVTEQEYVGEPLPPFSSSSSV